VTAISILIAVFLAFFLLGLMYKGAVLKKLDVTVSLSNSRAMEGARLVLTTVLTNYKWLPLPWVAVKFKISRHLIFADMENAQVTDYYYRNDLYNILMRQRITRRLSFECGKRGYYRLDAVDLTAWDILMEAKSAAIIECDAHLTVYPASLPAPVIDNLCVQIYGQLRAHNIMHPDPFSFRGIREYSPNDPLKSINFKASAKAQELMVNQWEYMNARQVILMYNLQRYNIWHNEVLDEYTIKLVASLAEQLISQNVPVRFITNGRAIKTGNAAMATEKTALSDEATFVPEGVGELQLERILEALALLDLEQTNIAPFSDIFSRAAEEYKLEPEYWLISTYHGPDLEAAYAKLMAQGARTVWILPRSLGIRMDTEDITLSPEIREQIILA